MVRPASRNSRSRSAWRGQRRAVAGQRQAHGLGQAVHRIGGEHARAGAAGGAGRAFDGGDIGVADIVVGGGNHGIDQVERLLCSILEDDLAGFHRTAGDEDHRNVEPHRGHQHAGRDLVAVGDADHGIGAMGVDHVFDGIGDEFARGQRIEHAVMTHGDAVIDGDGVEFLGDAARLLDLAGNQLAKILQVHVPGHELGEGVDHRDDRLAEITVRHARCAPQAAGARHVAAMGGCSRTIGRHVFSSRLPKRRPSCTQGPDGTDTLVMGNRPLFQSDRRRSAHGVVKERLTGPEQGVAGGCPAMGQRLGRTRMTTSTWVISMPSGASGRSETEMLPTGMSSTSFEPSTTK
jgi:hypothetical protein